MLNNYKCALAQVLATYGPWWNPACEETESVPQQL